MDRFSISKTALDFLHNNLRLSQRDIERRYGLFRIEDISDTSKLWDTENGITLCEVCHDLVTTCEDSYKDAFLHYTKIISQNPTYYHNILIEMRIKNEKTV